MTYQNAPQEGAAGDPAVWPFNFKQGKEKQHRNNGISAISQNALQLTRMMAQVLQKQTSPGTQSTVEPSFLEVNTYDITSNNRSHPFSLNITDSMTACPTGSTLCCTCSTAYVSFFMTELPSFYVLTLLRQQQYDEL